MTESILCIIFRLDMYESKQQQQPQHQTNNWWTLNMNMEYKKV